MPKIEMLIDSISQHLTNIQSGQQAFFPTIDLNYVLVSYNCIKALQNTAILTSFVENKLIPEDLKIDSTVSQTCQQNFHRKLWNENL